MGLFGKSEQEKDAENKNHISKNAGRYTRETLQNYNTARTNGSTPSQAFDFVKSDLSKRGVRL